MNELAPWLKENHAVVKNCGTHFIAYNRFHFSGTGSTQTLACIDFSQAHNLQPPEGAYTEQLKLVLK